LNQDGIVLHLIDVSIQDHRGNLWKNVWKGVEILRLDGQHVEQWNDYVNRLNINYIFLKEENDALVCLWSPSGYFTLSLGYKAMFLNEVLEVEW